MRQPPNFPHGGAPASFTQRLTATQEQVVVGAADVYEARCRRCFEPGGPEAQPELYPPEEEEADSLEPAP